MTDDWPETREVFRKIAAREGVAKIADEIPTHPTTVYRLITEEHKHPSRAVRAGIERVIENHKQDGQ